MRQQQKGAKKVSALWGDAHRYQLDDATRERINTTLNPHKPPDRFFQEFENIVSNYRAMELLHDDSKISDNKTELEEIEQLAKKLRKKLTDLVPSTRADLTKHHRRFSLSDFSSLCSNLKKLDDAAAMAFHDLPSSGGRPASSADRRQLALDMLKAFQKHLPKVRITQQADGKFSEFVGLALEVSGLYPIDKSDLNLQRVIADTVKKYKKKN